MSRKKRKIISEVTEYTNEEASNFRSDLIDQLEALRDVADIKTKEINQALGKTNNWYSNRARRGNISHDFALQDYCRVRIFLEMVVVRFHEEGYVSEEELGELVSTGALDPQLADKAREPQPA